MSAAIAIEDCRIGEALRPALASLSLRIERGESWAFVGPSGGGKLAAAAALAGAARVVPNEGGRYVNEYAGRAALVSFEAASALIEDELASDDSDFVEGGVSEGTTVRRFLASALPLDEEARYPRGEGLELHPLAVELGVASLLDRGLKRLSTGECRRVLVCRALIARPDLIVAVEPYQGLDAATRAALAARLEAMARRQASSGGNGSALIVVDELASVPTAVGMVAELEGGALRYAGPRTAYEARHGASSGDRAPSGGSRRLVSGALAAAREEAREEARRAPLGPAAGASHPLVELHDVTVSWSDKVVFDRLSWRVLPGEHWLVRGPNGSGKSTLLELIAGDHPQAYREDVRVFGRRRGSGVSIWELRSRIGLVSYRLHLEYRRLGGVSVEDVVISGLRDSIGLYGKASDRERAAAALWLELLGLRGREAFSRLSYGEQRSVLVARAAVKEPELLILDEPCHGLDASQRGFALALMDAVAERGRSTILHVTHDPLEVRPFARRVLELRPGSSPAWAIA